jgi:hypothetical protein
MMVRTSNIQRTQDLNCRLGIENCHLGSNKLLGAPPHFLKMTPEFIYLNLFTVIYGLEREFSSTKLQMID